LELEFENEEEAKKEREGDKYAPYLAVLRGSKVRCLIDAEHLGDTFPKNKGRYMMKQKQVVLGRNIISDPESTPSSVVVDVSLLDDGRTMQCYLHGETLVLITSLTPRR